jgi:hypothetical protein
MQLSLSIKLLVSEHPAILGPAQEVLFRGYMTFEYKSHFTLFSIFSNRARSRLFSASVSRTISLSCSSALSAQWLSGWRGMRCT